MSANGTVPLASYAAELYRSLLPLAYAEEHVDNALATYLGAFGSMFQEIDELVRDSDSGPGYSILFDVARCPSKALPWLGQFVGVAVDPARSDADQRQQIRDEAGMKRGTPGAIAAAAAPTLVGTRSVMFYERDPDAYSFKVRTFNDETPDRNATYAALLTQKPAGLLMDYAAIPRWTWRTLRDSFATWQDVIDHYADWQGVLTNTPPA
jgi:Phage tail protein (Tail_P2_I)